MAVEKDIRSLAPGKEARLCFANYDDRLFLEVGGTIVFVHDYRTDGEVLEESRVCIGLGKKGKLEIRRLKIERDIYYTDPEPIVKTKDFPWFHLGKKHFLMLGDNSRNSADSRAWTALYIKDPKTGEVIRGNFRPGGFTITQDPLNPDWNPVFVPRAKSLVFTDFYGEEYVITPRIPGTGEAWVEEAQRLINPAFGAKDDFKKLEPVYQVPREFIIGKAFFIFWPINPGQGMFRLGFIN